MTSRRGGGGGGEAGAAGRPRGGGGGRGREDQNPPRGAGPGGPGPPGGDAAGRAGAPPPPPAAAQGGQRPGGANCAGRGAPLAPPAAGNVLVGSGEEVLVARAHQRRRPRAVVGRDVALEAAHDDRRLARILVADEVRGGGRLVGDGDPRRAQLAPGAVAPPAPVRERP